MSAPRDLQQRLNQGTAMLIPSGRFAMGIVRFDDNTQATIASKGSGNDIVVVLLDRTYGIMANIPPRSTGHPGAEDMKVDTAIRRLVDLHASNRGSTTSYRPAGHYDPSKVWIFSPLDLLDPLVEDQLKAVRKSLEEKGIKPLQHLTQQCEGQERTILISRESGGDIPRVFLNGNPVPFR